MANNNENIDEMKRNSKLNKTLTLAAWSVTATVLFYNRLYFMFGGYLVFFLLFPICYVFFKFGMSDCINKPYVMDKGMDCDAMMVFKDSKKNVRVSKFIENEMLNANFWIVLVSLALIYLGLTM